MQRAAPAGKLGSVIEAEEAMTRRPARDVPIPEGAVTLLLGDVEGSTPMWERNSVAMSAAMSDGLKGLQRPERIDASVFARHSSGGCDRSSHSRTRCANSRKSSSAG